MPKDIKDGTVAVCSACEKMCAAALECECVFRIKDPDQKKKFRRSFPRKEYGISELVKRNQDYIKLHAEVERMRSVVEAARRLLGTLNVDESGLYKVVDVADEVGCSNLGGTPFEEHPDVDGAMEQMAAALAALDAAKETGKELGE